MYILSLSIIPFLPTDSTDQFVNVYAQPQIVEINSTFKKWECNNKAYLPIDLPEGAVGFIYSITPVSKKDRINPKASLLGEVSLLAKQHSVDRIADFISPTNSNKHFNMYLIPGNEYIQSFSQCGFYKYLEKHIGTKPRAAFVKNPNRAETIFLGIENPKDLKNLRLKVEVVAVMNK